MRTTLFFASFFASLPVFLQGLWTRSVVRIRATLPKRVMSRESAFQSTTPEEESMSNQARPLIREALATFRATKLASVLVPEGVGHRPDALARAKALAAAAGLDHTMGNLLQAQLTITPALLRRLFGLWNALAIAGADEIADWSVNASVRVECPGLPLQIDVAGVGATIYLDGRVSFSVLVFGADTSLWLADQFDLTAVEQVQLKHELSDRHAAV